MLTLIRSTGLVIVVAAGAAQAQTTPTPDAPAAKSPGAPSVTAPETPPNGIARGVIRPNAPVDSDMVTQPPAHGQSMPVIKPPGTAR